MGVKFMTDTSFPLMLVGIGATAMVGQSFAIPDWSLVAAAALAGSLFSTWHKLFDASKRNRGLFAIFGDIIIGAVTGIAIAKLLISYTPLNAQDDTWLAFLMAHIGASVSQKLSSRDGKIADGLFGLFSKIIGRGTTK